jgi:hypothetical protein
MRVIDIITVLSLSLSTLAKLETEGIKLPLPTRELEWKDVNFISISDSHGTSSPFFQVAADEKAGYLVINM